MNSTTINLHRINSLVRYEWRISSRFYLLGTIGIFLIVFGVFLTIWFNNPSWFTWKPTNYNITYYVGLMFLSVFGISQSFVDLRKKNTAIRYLTLPASIIEKYLTQVGFRLILPFILYNIVFWLGANLSVEVYYFIQQTLLGKTSLPQIEKAEFFYLYWIPSPNMDLIYWNLFGTILLVPTLMFLGGILFGKWNFILMPLAVTLILLFFLGTYLGLSRILDARAFGTGDNYAIILGYPEVMGNVPLSVVVSTVFVWASIILAFVVTYFKLKEKEI